MIKEGAYNFTNQEILGGLKSAIARGESLKDAMMTFYQAGYDKSEIEEAARSYLNEGNHPVIDSSKNQEKTDLSQDVTQKKSNISAPSFSHKKEESRPISKTVQKVSNYLPPNKDAEGKGEKLTIILVIILLLLLGVLASVFLFREELVNFFNSLFG